MDEEQLAMLKKLLEDPEIKRALMPEQKEFEIDVPQWVKDKQGKQTVEDGKGLFSSADEELHKKISHTNAPQPKPKREQSSMRQRECRDCGDKVLVVTGSAIDRNPFYCDKCALGK